MNVHSHARATVTRNAAPEVVVDVKVSLMCMSNCEAQYRAFSVFQE